MKEKKNQEIEREIERKEEGSFSLVQKSTVVKFETSPVERSTELMIILGGPTDEGVAWAKKIVPENSRVTS